MDLDIRICSIRYVEYLPITVALNRKIISPTFRVQHFFSFFFSNTLEMLPTNPHSFGRTYRYVYGRYVNATKFSIHPTVIRVQYPQLYNIVFYSRYVLSVQRAGGNIELLQCPITTILNYCEIVYGTQHF